MCRSHHVRQVFTLTHTQMHASVVHTTTDASLAIRSHGVVFLVLLFVARVGNLFPFAPDSDLLLPFSLLLSPLHSSFPSHNVLVHRRG